MTAPPQTVPSFPRSLPGSIWAVTSYFNPHGNENRKTNYLSFRENIKNHGLNLLCVELSHNKTPHSLSPDDAEIMIRLNSDSIIWHKERLLNIGIENLPPDCDKFVWIDADVFFIDTDWVNQTVRLLEKYTIVQPFSHIIFLPEGKRTVCSQSDFFKKTNKVPGSAYKISLSGTDCLRQKYPPFGWPGLVWAARKNIFKSPGLYDRLILGGADTAMVNAFYGVKKISFCDDALSFFEYSLGLRHDFEQWFDLISSSVKGSVFYRQGVICHMYHGDMATRMYRERELAIKVYKYDPFSDIKLGPDRTWEWTDSNPKIRRYADKFFKIRARNKLKNPPGMKIIRKIGLISSKIISYSSGDKGKIETPLIVVTPTYERHGRLLYLTRVARTLARIPNILWIIVEDDRCLNSEVQKLLMKSNIRHVYLNYGPTLCRGNAQRDHALKYITKNDIEGIIYLADDHNYYDVRLFAEIRKTKKVSVFPVGFLGTNNMERPICKNGKVVGWDPDRKERKFPIDKAGFAFRSDLLRGSEGNIWNFDGRGGKTEFLEKIVPSCDELEPLCSSCSRCYAWHDLPLHKDPIFTFYRIRSKDFLREVVTAFRKSLPF